jgi:hypothetical protein
MVKLKKVQVIIVSYLFVMLMIGCAATQEKEMREMKITDVGVLEGKWSGWLTNGPSNVLTVKEDGSWTNVVKGRTFKGIASIKDEKIHVESFTTGILYNWRIYENNGSRTLKWVDIGSGKVVATDKFSASQ